MHHNSLKFPVAFSRQFKHFKKIRKPKASFIVTKMDYCGKRIHSSSPLNTIILTTVSRATHENKFTEKKKKVAYSEDINTRFYPYRKMIDCVYTGMSVHIYIRASPDTAARIEEVFLKNKTTDERNSMFWGVKGSFAINRSKSGFKDSLNI